MSRKLTAGASLAQYKIIELLGEGGMGAVYEALDESLDRHVAIKTLLSDVAQDPESRKRFFREGKAAAKLRHPHVVEVYGVGIENEVPYLVMELLAGESLAALLEREKKLPPERAIDILLPVLSALVVAHDEGVIHRDLKPDNIFLQQTRAKTVVPKLLDFGISKVTGAHNSRITHTSALMGTPYYMSPEQARGQKDVDAQVDQWAMGVILYEVLAGVRPITGETVLEILHRIATMPLVPLDVAAPDVPPELAKIVMRALDRDRAKRWPSIRVLGHALLPFASPGARTTWGPAFERGASSESLPAPARPAAEDAQTIAASPRSRADGDAGPASDPPTSERAGSEPVPISISLSGTSAGRKTGSGLTRNLEPAATSSARTGPVTLPETNPTLVAIAVAVLAVAVVGIIAAFGSGSEAASAAPSASDTPTEPRPADPGGTSSGATPPGGPEPGTPEPGAPEPREPGVQPPASAEPEAVTSFEAAIAASPAEARIELDGALVATGTWTASLALDGREHRVRVTADGYDATEVVFTDAPPPREIVLRRAAIAARTPRAGTREPATTMAEPATMSSASMADPGVGTSQTTVGANGAPILE